jgi:hypothetical protein
MTRQRTPSRNRARELKMVLSAAAVAATLGGWAALAADTPPTTAVAAAPQSQQLELPPAPTVVPLTGEATANPEAAQPAPQPQVLRDVSAPPAASWPAPIASTRSSR